MSEVDRHFAIAWLSLGHHGALPAAVPARITVLKPVNSRANSTPATTDGTALPVDAHHYALMHTAMYDAVASIDGGHPVLASYLSGKPHNG